VHLFHRARPGDDGLHGYGTLGMIGLSGMWVEGNARQNQIVLHH
jgi:hypothetical protein